MLIVVSGPAGSGKTTLCSRLTAAYPQAIRRVITCTTRAPRPGEVDGVDYHFLARAEFEKQIAAGVFLEHATVHGNLYGPRAKDVAAHLDAGFDALLNVDVQGAATIRAQAASNPRLAAALVTARLESEGVSIRTKHRALRFETGKKLVVAGPEGEAAIAYDDIIIAVGRKPRVSGFGLEELGLVVDGRLENDVFLRTSMPHILCAGDVAGRQQLTHGGSHEAWYASVNALARPFKKYQTDYRVLPRVTYTEPELATVGLTQAEAEEQGASFDATRYDLDDLDRAIAESEAHGFVKILTAKGSDRILGATIIGQNAGEILAEVTFAMKHNMGLRKILQTIHPYPTWAEANKYAAGQFGLARKPVALLKWAERWFRWQRG